MNEDMGISKRLSAPLSGFGKPISWMKCPNGRRINWGKTKFELSDKYVDDILNSYFKDSDAWYPLGASMDNPIVGGFGEYIQKNIPSLTPRHASAIAAIMVDDNLIDHKGKKPIMLRKKQR